MLSNPGLVVIVLLVIAFILLEVYASPHIRPLSLDDASIQYPLLPNIVPTGVMLVGSFILPPAVYALASWGTVTIGGMIPVLMATLESNLITMVATDMIKFAVGRPRPYFASVCVDYSPPDTSMCTGSPELSDEENEARIAEGRVSFPSGHSSISFSAGVLASLFLLALWRKGRVTRNMTVFLIIAMVPIALATYVAVSRLIDYHHHYADVIGGSLLGAGIASFVYAVRSFEEAAPEDASGIAAASAYGAV